MNLASIQAVIMDMDGVLWRGDEALPGMSDFFAFLRSRDIPFVMATNNSARSQASYLEKLVKLGARNIEEWQIITSGIVTADTLKQRYAPQTRLHILGGDGLRETLAHAGFIVADSDARAVVVGIDFDLNYDKLRRAHALIRMGAEFIGTNGDVTYPTPEGLVPGAGSIIALLETASGTKADIMGKPGRAMFDTAVRLMGQSPEQTLMIGDRLDTDILGGQNANLKTALVLTGVTSFDEAITHDVRPDAIYDDLIDLMQKWGT